MHSLSSSGIVHHGDRSVTEYGPVAREMRGVGGMSMCITPYSGRLACLNIVTASVWCLGMSSKYVATRLVVVSARSLPLMFVCPLIFCIIVGRPGYILYWSEVTMAAMSGL
jgi:hypothetical protein